MKILVAEDDKYLGNAYRVKLTKANFEIYVVEDGKQAVEALQKQTFDLVILDLIMPVKDGFSVLEFIKSSDALKKIPVIVASNLGQSEDIVKATKLGADDYIIKTELSMKNLLDKITILLKKNQAGQINNAEKVPQVLNS